MERENRGKHLNVKDWRACTVQGGGAGPFGPGPLLRQMYRHSGMRGGESETEMKSPGTTVYYQDSSRGSTQASEPAGGRDRGGRKERRMTEVGNWWGWQGRRQQKQLLGVRRLEGLRGTRGRQKKQDGRHNVGKSKCFLIYSSTFPQLRVSQISLILTLYVWCQICTAVIGNPLIKSLWYFSHVYLIIAHSDPSDVARTVPCRTVHSCRVAATLLIHSRRNYLESYAVPFQD